jgi:hypothetical protein
MLWTVVIVLAILYLVISIKKCRSVSKSAGEFPLAKGTAPTQGLFSEKIKHTPCPLCSQPPTGHVRIARANNGKAQAKRVRFEDRDGNGPKTVLATASKILGGKSKGPKKAKTPPNHETHCQKSKQFKGELTVVTEEGYVRGLNPKYPYVRAAQIGHQKSPPFLEL